jgi:hypothetical protein
LDSVNVSPFERAMHFYRKKEWDKAEPLFREVINNSMNLVTEEKIREVWDAMYYQAYCFSRLSTQSRTR